MVVYDLQMEVLTKIRPTPEQLPILSNTGMGFRLIRGAAGCGKTTAALMRLRQLCAARLVRKMRMGLADPVRVLVLTFNRTLRGYVQHLATEQVPDGASAEVDLTVKTFSSWAFSLCPWVTIVDQGKLIRKLLKDTGFTDNLDYLVGEVEYILGRFPFDEKVLYLDAGRLGRGRTPAITRPIREVLLNKVITSYEKEKARLGKVDWNDVALKAAKVNCQGYDVVVVDEAQDLSANQIRSVLAHLSENHNTTFIIDAVQRIYPQAFQWQEVGLTIRPNQVYTLKQNHRNTAAISHFAASIVQDLPTEDDGVVPDPSKSLHKGSLPEILVGRYSAQIDYMLNVIQPYLASGDTVAILQPRGGSWFDFARQALRRRKVLFCELTRTSDWPEGPEQVALSTIHSAKGLEFDHVLLPGLNQEVTPHGLEDGDGSLESLRRLLAMGIGRARKSVTLGYNPEDKSTLINLIDQTTYNLVSVG